MFWDPATWAQDPKSGNSSKVLPSALARDGKNGGADRSAGTGVGRLGPVGTERQKSLPALAPALWPAPTFCCQHLCQHPRQHFSGIPQLGVQCQFARIPMVVTTTTTIMQKDKHKVKKEGEEEGKVQREKQMGDKHLPNHLG